MTADSHFGCPFGTVAIVGVGLIGGSLGMALKARRLAQRVVGVGRDSARLETAVRLGAIDEFALDGAVSLRDADIIVLCTTVRHIEQALPDILASARSGAIVTDVGSTKSVIVARADGAANFVGGHPMAGSERGGVEAATPTLFQEATWALTPTLTTDPEALLTIQTLAQEVGATTRIFTPEAHDAMVAVTSHVPHVLASALMRLAARTRAEYPETPALAAGSFADMTRVAASSPELWRDVCLTNREAVQHTIAGFRAELAALEIALDAEDADALAAFFREGAMAKNEWPPRSS